MAKPCFGRTLELPNKCFQLRIPPQFWQRGKRQRGQERHDVADALRGAEGRQWWGRLPAAAGL